MTSRFLSLIGIKLSIVLTVWCNCSLAQSNDYISYYNHIEKAYHVGVFKNNNDSVIFYVKKAVAFAKPFPEDLFILSKALNDKGFKQSSFEVFLQAVRSGLDSVMLHDVYEDYELNSNQIKQCKQEYDNFHYDIDSLLYYSLDSVINKDQRLRKELHAYKKGTPEFDSLELKMFEQDSLNRCWLLKTMNEKGFPGRKNIGNDSKSFVLLLHIKKPWFDENRELLKRQIKEGYLNPCYLAASIDRYSFLKEGIIYGSFLPKNIPFEDSKAMKQKRAEIGALSRNVFFKRMQIKIRK